MEKDSKNAALPSEESANEQPNVDTESIVPSTSTGMEPLDFTLYKNRKATFHDGWGVNFLKPKIMARCGFYFLGVGDIVKCAFCNVELEDWKPTDSPVIQHEKVSPDCRVFSARRSNDVKGLFGAPPKCIAFDDEERKKVDEFLLSIHEEPLIECPRNLLYEDFGTRLASYKKCRTLMKYDPYTYCEAGFYYDNRIFGSYFTCFHCGISIGNLQRFYDDPWSAHAVNSPSCGFLVVNKGRYYILEILGIHINKTFITMDDVEESSHSDLSEFDEMEGAALEEDSGDEDWLVREWSDEQDGNVSYVIDLSGDDIPGELLCRVCMDDQMAVAFIPCGHIFACKLCISILENCPMCRKPFTDVLDVEISPTVVARRTFTTYGYTDEPVDARMCKICFVEPITVAYPYCNHVYVCKSCAEKNYGVCPKCRELVLGPLINVFL